MSDSMRGSYEDRQLDKGVKFWYAEAGKLEAQAAKYRKALERLRENSHSITTTELEKIVDEALKP